MKEWRKFMKVGYLPCNHTKTIFVSGLNSQGIFLFNDTLNTFLSMVINVSTTKKLLQIKQQEISGHI